MKAARSPPTHFAANHCMQPSLHHAMTWLAALTACQERPKILNRKHPSTSNSPRLKLHPSQYHLSNRHHLPPPVSMNFASSIICRQMPCLLRSRTHTAICTMTHALHICSCSVKGVVPAAVSRSCTIARLCEYAGRILCWCPCCWCTSHWGLRDNSCYCLDDTVRRNLVHSCTRECRIARCISTNRSCQRSA